MREPTWLHLLALCPSPLRPTQAVAAPNIRTCSANPCHGLAGLSARWSPSHTGRRMGWTRRATRCCPGGEITRTWIRDIIPQIHTSTIHTHTTHTPHTHTTHTHTHHIRAGVQIRIHLLCSSVPKPRRMPNAGSAGPALTQSRTSRYPAPSPRPHRSSHQGIRRGLYSRSARAPPRRVSRQRGWCHRRMPAGLTGTSHSRTSRGTGTHLT